MALSVLSTPVTNNNLKFILKYNAKAKHVFILPLEILPNAQIIVLIRKQ